MADEVEKFVLQYEVSMKDAITRLEQLNNKVDQVPKGTKKATEGFKEFATGASDEIGRIVPGIGRITGAVGIMSASFIGAAAAVAVLAAGVKSVMALREQYNAQRVVGMGIGVSSMRVEEYQRKFIKYGEGSVSREKSAEQLKNIADMQHSAYADLTRVGTEARKFKLMGVEVGGVGKPQVPFNELISQMGERFAKMKPAEVQGQAKAFGIDENFALALAKMGPSIGKITEHTNEEVEARAKAEASLTEFNSNLAKLDQSFNTLEISLGQKLLPAFTALIDIIDKIVNLIPKDSVSGFVTNQANFATGNEKPSTSFLENLARHPVAGAGPFGAAYRTYKARTQDTSNLVTPIGSAQEEREKAEARRLDPSLGNQTGRGVIDRASPASKVGDVAKDTKTAKSLDELANSADRINSEASQNAAKMTTAINMFAGAVASFANAIDERQAWAAWAGEAGRASGLVGPMGLGRAAGRNAANDVRGRDFMAEAAASIAGSGKMPSTPWDQAFIDAERRHGIPAGTLKNQARVESEFNPNAVSEAGAEGLLQIMPANKKALGITDSMDPLQNIEGAAKLMAENLAATNGNLREALMMYHAGPKKEGWGPKTRAYPGKVMGVATEPQDTQREWSGVPSVKEREEQRAIQDANRLRKSVRDQSIGEERASLNLKATQQNIASRLGVDVKQVQQGGVNRGDVEFATSQLKAGVENQIFNLNKELQAVNLPQSTRSKLISDVREQQYGLQQLERYGPEVAERQQEGGRSITIGERAIQINLNGVQDPEANARAIAEQLDARLQDIANRAATGVKI